MRIWILNSPVLVSVACTELQYVMDPSSSRTGVIIPYSRGPEVGSAMIAASSRHKLWGWVGLESIWDMGRRKEGRKG